MSTEVSKSYFKHTNPLISFLVIAGMTLCHLGCYYPHVVPDEYMGPIGWMYRYLAYSKPFLLFIIYYCAIVAHLAEGFYALYLTKKKGIIDPFTRLKWFIQTTALGIFSLSFLIEYNPEKND